MPSGEDDLIARYFKPLATDPGALGLTDDAAFLKGGGDAILEAIDLVGVESSGDGGCFEGAVDDGSGASIDSIEFGHAGFELV